MENQNQTGSRFFSAAELACKCGCGLGMKDMDQSFLNRLDMLRISYGGPLIITSGFRCKLYNEKIKGAKNSQHCLGMAVDIHVAEADKRWNLVACAMALGFSVAADTTFVHIDTRPGTKLMWLYPQHNGD